MRGSGFSRRGNECAIDLFQRVVMFTAVEGALDATQSALVFRSSGHRAGETEGSDGRDLVGVEEVDAAESDLQGLFTKRF